MQNRAELEGVIYHALRRLYDSLPRYSCPSEHPDGCPVCEARAALKAWEMRDPNLLYKDSEIATIDTVTRAHVRLGASAVQRTASTPEDKGSLRSSYVSSLHSETYSSGSGDIDAEVIALYESWLVLLRELRGGIHPDPDRVRKVPGPRLVKILGRALKEADLEECIAAVRGAYIEWSRTGKSGKGIADVFATFRNTGSLLSRINYFSNIAGYHSSQNRGLDAPGVRDRVEDVRREIRAAIDMPDNEGAQRRAAEGERWLHSIGLCILIDGRSFVLAPIPSGEAVIFCFVAPGAVIPPS